MSRLNEAFRQLKARVWELRGRRPHAYGYNPARWAAIERDIRSGTDRYGWSGAGFDERAVEYPWTFHRMTELRARQPGRVLDAGSVLNYPRVLGWWRDANNPPVSIVTLAYEGHAHVSQATRYEFGDLRNLPYRDGWFSVVVSLSTLEHVGLDNRVYGAHAEHSGDPGAEALAAIAELGRVTASGGSLLISVPFGARSNRGWFRILDEADVLRLVGAPGWTDARVRYFRSMREGWRECSASEASTAGYNEPKGSQAQHTAPPWVAGAEAVALLELRRL
jgi:hypothetical protein